DERFAGDGPRHGDALLLPAGQLARQMFGAMRHADTFERRRDALPPLARGHSAIGEGKLDVLEDTQIADQIEALEDETDLAITNARALGGREVGHGPVVQEVF